jgi:CHAD domain-containing protein
MTLEVPTASYLLDPDADVAAVLDVLGVDIDATSPAAGREGPVSALVTAGAGDTGVEADDQGPVSGPPMAPVDGGGPAAGDLGTGPRSTTGPAGETTTAVDPTPSISGGDTGSAAASRHRAAAPATRGGKEPHVVTVVLLDTADRLLRAAGLELVATTGGGATASPSPPSGGATAGAAPLGGGGGGAQFGAGEVLLILRGRAGEPPMRAVAPRAPRYLVPELPAGPLRDRLAPVIDIRALLPIVEVHREELPAAVRNRDGKIVVRLSITRLSAQPARGVPAGDHHDGDHHDGDDHGNSDDGNAHLPAAATGLPLRSATDEPVTLHTRVELSGVLGYPKAFARVQEALTSPPLSLPEAAESVVDEAVTALGGIPQGLAGKVEVGLRPGDRADVAALRILRSLAHVVESNLPGTLADYDTEFLHDLRVAVRKSRSVLRELKRVFDPDVRQVQADSLRWVQAITGPTRDLDVQLLEWDEVVGHLPDERRRQHLEPVRVLLQERRAEALAQLIETLEGDGFRQRWSAWRAFLAGDLGPEDQRPDAALPVREVAARRIHTVYRRMVKMGEAIDDTSPAQALHDLRKRGKELRYLLELFGGLWPSSTIKPLVSRLKGLQDLLGLHQDREVQAIQLRTLAPDLTSVAGGAEAILAMGSLVDGLEHQQEMARHRFAEWFGPFTQVELPR